MVSVFWYDNGQNKSLEIHYLWAFYTLGIYFREWRHDKTRSRYFSSGGTPSTPKSEGSESRSSPVVSDEEDEIDSDVISDDDEVL